MSNVANPEGDARPSLGEAFDWRAGRTWAVFLGSALVCGSLIAAGVLAVQILYLGLPSAPLGEGDLTTGTFLVLLVVVPPYGVLTYLLNRGGLKASKGTPAEVALKDLPRPKTWKDLWILLLWNNLHLVPLAIAHFGLFGAPHHAGFLAGMGIAGTVGYNLFLLPAFLRRWA